MGPAEIYGILYHVLYFIVGEECISWGGFMDERNQLTYVLMDKITEDV